MKSYLRIAVPEDGDLLFAWANDENVRRNSFSTEKIAYEEHIQWFAKMLERKDGRQYIYMDGDEPAGQIRFTIDGGTAEIGYSICAEKRGQGHGKQMLALAQEQIKRDFPEVRKLKGKVKPGNLASQKTFLNAGFEETYYVYEITV